MKVYWSPRATRHRGNIWRAISAADLERADRMDDRFREAANLLSSAPAAGKPGAEAGTREFLAHPSYRLIYEVGPDSLTILAVLHTKRNWPPA